MGRSRSRLIGVTLVAALGLVACGSDEPASDTGSGGANGGTTATPVEKVNLSLVGFAVPKAANNAIQAGFAKTPAGAGTTWTESYGASGDQSRAVVAGLKADYVHLSLEGDVTRLVTAGLVAEDWDKGPNRGIVSTSVVVIAVRQGNPKKIASWDDIVKPGIGIVTPNPGSSGAARWNILAAYGQAYARNGSEQEGKDYLKKFFGNVVALPGSGRDATTAFLAGTGDVLISYENETILARQEGSKLDYFVPAETLLIENPGAVLKDAHPRATEWLDYVLSEAGQSEFVKKGFRAVGDTVTGVAVEGANDPANPFPAPTKLFTIATDFGGWPAATEKFFKDKTGIVPVIQAEANRV